MILISDAKSRERKKARALVQGTTDVQGECGVSACPHAFSRCRTHVQSHFASRGVGCCLLRCSKCRGLPWPVVAAATS